MLAPNDSLDAAHVDFWTLSGHESARDLAKATAPVGALPHADQVRFFAALALVMVFARALGELARFFKQPAVLGELIAGIILGKTCLGNIWPEAFNYLFGAGSKATTAQAGVTAVCATLYMFVAGMEMNFVQVKQRARATMYVQFLSFVIPLALGVGVAWAQPQLMGMPADGERAVYAAFVGVAMSITAMPVAAKTLRDLGLYNSNMGIIVMSSATLDDVCGWCVFAVVLAVGAGQDSDNGLGVAGSVVVSILYVIFMLTIARWLLNRSMASVHAYFSFPGGIFGYMGVVTLASACFALWLGLHHTLGGFLAGTMFGNSKHLRYTVRESFDLTVSNVLAPLFFGSVCLNANFVADFAVATCAMVLFIACLGKLVGGYAGGRLSKQSVRDSWAIAVCMNTRGAMELILANVARDAGLIDGTMFVALVLMAILTSLVPGPLIRWILRVKDVQALHALVPKRGFVKELTGSSGRDALRELLGRALPGETALEKIVVAGTETSEGTAVPHAVLPGLKRALLIVGVSRRGVALGGRAPAHVLALLLCPSAALELELLPRVQDMMARAGFADEIINCSNRTELVALLRVEAFLMGLHTRPAATVAPPALLGGELARIEEDGESVEAASRVETSSLPSAAPVGSPRGGASKSLESSSEIAALLRRNSRTDPEGVRPEAGWATLEELAEHASAQQQPGEDLGSAKHEDLSVV